jgi:hypothetical protein
MFKLQWDQTGEKLYETGLDRGVLYVRDDKAAYPNGVAWNGLISVTEGVSGGEANPFYADNIKYANVTSAEEFNPSIEAYMSPVEFDECDGSKEIAPGITIGQQERKTFGLSYRSKIGNDVDDTEYGYKIHLVYGALAAPSEKSRQTVNESPELMTMSWECSTTPVAVTGFKPTAHLVINSKSTSADKLAELEKILYGDGETAARLPLPDEIIELVGTEAAG